MPQDQTQQLGAIESVLDAMLKSENASEFCRSLVHSDFMGDATQGCQLFLLDNKSRLSTVAGYGLAPEDLNQASDELSAWDNNPVSTCVREKQHIFETAKAGKKSLVCVPLLRDHLPVGVLYILAVTSIGVYGVVLAGWSSGSTYPLLGGLRSSAQVISYEVAMGLSLVAVFIYAGSMSTSDIVASQHGHIWNAVVLFPSFVIYVISMVGETNRAPFDLAEAEGELVGGFHTEYSSLKFALFFLAEYVNIVAVSALATTLFLGGYHALPGLGFTESWLGGWFVIVWFFLKVNFFFFIFMWLRASLPRLRYDQFMKFGWKVLIPASLLWIMIVASLRVIQQNGASRTVALAFALGIVVIVMAISSLFEKSKNESRKPLPAGEAPDFPLPQLPGVSSFSASTQSHTSGGTNE